MRWGGWTSRSPHRPPDDRRCIGEPEPGSRRPVPALVARGERPQPTVYEDEQIAPLPFGPMGPSHAAPAGVTEGHHLEALERKRVWREGITMVLYVAVVLLATLSALPAGHDPADAEMHGPVGGELLAIVWGTTVGLALAHWFAFHVATPRASAGDTSASRTSRRQWPSWRAPRSSPRDGEPAGAPVRQRHRAGGGAIRARPHHRRCRLSRRTRQRTLRKASVLFGVVTLAVAFVVATLKLSVRSLILTEISSGPEHGALATARWAARWTPASRVQPSRLASATVIGS